MACHVRNAVVSALVLMMVVKSNISMSEFRSLRSPCVSGLANGTTMYGPRDFRPGDLVWFDPGVGYVLPGEVLEFHKAAQVITVQAVINNITKTFTLNNLSSVKTRQDLGQNGVEDMVTLSDLNEASILWNLRIR